MASIINFLRNLKLLAIMVYSAILGSAYLRKFTPETLCYCRSMGYERLLDIYRPKASTQKALPTIVWFHGGAWKMGDRKAIERIAAAAKANGKPWGALSRTEEFALKCRELGCQLFSIAGDLDYINRGIAANKSAFPNFFS